MTKEIKNFEGIDIGIKGESMIISGTVQMDGTYHPAQITKIELENMCDSLLINELEARGYTLKKESKLNHIERMELELEELNDKIVKGQQFLDKEYENHKFTDEVQRFSLEEQLKHMRGYREYLKGRISYDFLKQHKNDRKEIK
ncbi:MAG: crAss001_48 related protein [Filifactoraceae bacterium]